MTTYFLVGARRPVHVSSFGLLADFTLDVWLLARYAKSFAGRALDGRQWERAVSGLLHRPGFSRRQGPGCASLFGSASASGVPHELDGAADGWLGSIMIECKTLAVGITKADVALFHYKVFDFYQQDIATASSENWWCLMCGTSRTSASARAAAISLGVLTCDPTRLPLPVLVRAASVPSADIYLPEALLQEVVRLGARALCTHQRRWRYCHTSGDLRFRPQHWKAREIRDLLWLEDELTRYLLDLYEKRRPGALDRAAAGLIWQMRKVA